MSTISTLSAGGTFEKAYSSGAGVRDLSFPEESAVKDILTHLGIRNVELFYDPKRAKDSLDMTDEDRHSIAEWCANDSRYRCIVIHGTDTMVETARVVAGRCPNKVVVFTGALQPARMRNSDAEFNLGGAIAAAQTCDPGVYIFMSGVLYRWDKCRKNPETGRFDPL